MSASFYAAEAVTLIAERLNKKGLLMDGDIEILKLGNNPLGSA
jgi:hypothetical protein